jgi:iron complex transport system permease protein
MTNKIKIYFILICCFAAIILGVCIGAVNISVSDVLKTFANKLFSVFGVDYDVPAGISTIVWNVRFPRVITAFLAGAALAVSGTVMQSVLRNPLASSYTLGVSSGAALGVALFIVFGTVSFFGILTTPFIGLISGMITVFLIVTFAQKVDREFNNHTIILTGIVLSLFITAIMTSITSMFRNNTQQIILWQTGSFDQKTWREAGILAVLTIICVIYLSLKSFELDIMSFGEEQSKTMGVNQNRMKWLLLGVSSALTGAVVSFIGIIGFIDLIAPHIVRKLFGAKHKYVIPISALFGGSFMVMADLVSRTVIAPRVIPVGAITALIGAPFFCYVFFFARGKNNN